MARVRPATASCNRLMRRGEARCAGTPRGDGVNPPPVSSACRCVRTAVWGVLYAMFCISIHDRTCGDKACPCECCQRYLYRIVGEYDGAHAATDTGMAFSAPPLAIEAERLKNIAI